MVALVRGVHGLRGAVRIEVLTDHPDDRFRPGARLHREGSSEALTVVESVPDGPGWRLRFAEVADRAAADSMRGVYLEALRGPADELPRGAYYWHEVVGTTVRDVDDRELGVVTDVYRVGEAEVFVVRGEPFGEFDLPAVRAFIRIFAPKRGEIVADVDALDLRPPKPKPDRPPRPRRPTRRRVGIPAGGPPQPTGAGPAADDRPAGPHTAAEHGTEPSGDG